MADWLPDKNWQVKTKIGKDGSKSEYYYNKETGQTFHTKEDMLRYANYVKNVEPHLEGFKACYMDSERQVYVDRPWQHDSKHTMLDYIQGRVGKYKGQAAGSSSAAETDAMGGEEKPEQKLKGEAPASSSVLVADAKSGGGKTQQKKKKKKKVK
ncbi:uncharacterized protein LOC130791599 [Actinidia eriantha]|uniref:uncharacterized protein LOC130791599 n=1 Tax=Actinidia eriantha TaxID=165200 RepID=UPI00258C420E|nr:uncharacterized protein LOC130791599 [Actinidia eriantha]XP_057508778.1 uncharacterized protein LOC130791599 [Actinidia eriantha]XP_057508779.1 uncharacterized protein LOC130791599 [Actinidia eriantha]XP_057508780.1 uncharacterized protein LOC130791599 [Actinidia eriantha]XP_057508781.1 uncharacterized protein LOC130791599 [Actinidia eriantha]XP_057508782.1 uncharacterized protein LOC130791599 [Actinidia eriantha]XP_057508783.1 uncharacterized protein LOC130791599 [Actinidia eriantha]XP_0